MFVNCHFSSFPNSMVPGGSFVAREQGRNFGLSPPSSAKTRIHGRRVVGVTAFLFDPSQKPILKEALKEPVAFMGGMFAGLLRVDLNEDPLKEWITRTVEASGITEEEIGSEDAEAEEVPVQIEIE